MSTWTGQNERRIHKLLWLKGNTYICSKNKIYFRVCVLDWLCGASCTRWNSRSQRQTQTKAKPHNILHKYLEQSNIKMTSPEIRIACSTSPKLCIAYTCLHVCTCMHVCLRYVYTYLYVHVSTSRGRQWIGKHIVSRMTNNRDRCTCKMKWIAFLFPGFSLLLVCCFFVSCER